MASKSEAQKKSALNLAAWNLPDWMENFDAVKAAPDFHQVVFESEKIRMLFIEIKPGEEEPIHTHKWKSFLWFANYSPSVYTEYKLNGEDQLIVNKTFEIPQLDLNKGIELEPEGAHTVKNIGTEVLRLYRMEFKK